MIPLPSRRWLALAFIAAAAFLVSAPLALLLDAALLVLLVVDARRATADLVVTRRLPGPLSLGERGACTVEVRSPSAWVAHVQLTDDLPPSLDRLGPERAEGPVTDARPVTLTYEFRAQRRGAHIFGHVHLRVLGPLGLAWRSVVVPRRDVQLVVPGLAEARRTRLLGLRERLRRAGVRNTRQKGEGRGFESLREYVAGDDPRTVDWKSTAHRGRLIVREYQAERSQSVLLVLDAGRMMTERIGEWERLDHAMSAALLLADVAAVQGDRVGLFAFADQVLAQLPPRRVDLSNLSRTMAGVQARMVEPNYPASLSRLSRSLTRRSLVILFTDVIDSTVSHPLLAQLHRLARHHVVLAVAVRNPDLEEWAVGDADSTVDLYRRVAAEQMLERRAVAMANMRRAGVHVADVAPHQLVTEVVNRYLEIKYRGLV